jgi:hypothetical protein
MVDNSVVFIDLRVQSLLKGQLSNMASVSVELSAITLLSIFLCHRQFCCPIESTAHEIRFSGSAYQNSLYSAYQGSSYSAHQDFLYSVYKDSSYSAHQGPSYSAP